jgi:hypothetical protein
VAFIEGSATLVAVTLPVPPAAGAVNTPAGVIVPNDVVQITELFAAPWIAAVNWTWFAGAGVAVAGETMIEVTIELVGLARPTQPLDHKVIGTIKDNKSIRAVLFPGVLICFFSFSL